MRLKVTVNHKRMWAYNTIDVCTSSSYSAHQSIWHALIKTTLFLCQKKREEFFVECLEIARADQSNRWQFSPAIFGNCNNCTALEWITYMQLQQRKVTQTANAVHHSCSLPAMNTYHFIPSIHAFILSVIHSFNRGHRHLTADQPLGLLGKHEFIGYY